MFLDVAAEGVGDGRGDASSSSNGPLAYGIEQCACPPGYTGLSCQVFTNFIDIRVLMNIRMVEVYRRLMTIYYSVEWGNDT